MGVFKEEAAVFEKIASQQTRIYYDAADYGYPYNTKDVPPEVTAVLVTIKQLTELDNKFPAEKNLVRNREEWGSGVSVDVIIFWERDEGFDVGTKYSISFDRTGSHHSRIDKSSNAFISIDINPYSEKS